MMTIFFKQTKNMNRKFTKDEINMKKVVSVILKKCTLTTIKEY